MYLDSASPTPWHTGPGLSLPSHSTLHQVVPVTVLSGLFIELKPGWRDREGVWRPAGERSAGIVTTHRPTEAEEEREKERPGWAIHRSHSQRQGAAGCTDLASLLPCSHWLRSAGQEGAPRRPCRAQSRLGRQRTEGWMECS